MYRSESKTKGRRDSRRGTWSREEDQIIIDNIDQGFSKWSDIGKKIPMQRTGKQCRERWFNHLDPQLKKEPWSDDEDRALLEAQSRLGNSWTKIATEMPGRSENEVKNRWYSAAIRSKHMKFNTGQKRRLETEEEKIWSRTTSRGLDTGSLETTEESPTPNIAPLKLPSILRSSQNLFMYEQLRGDSSESNVNYFENAQQLLLQGEGHTLGSGLTTPLSFMGGALSAFNSGAASPTWFEGATSSNSSLAACVGANTHASSASVGASIVSANSAGGDSVTDALQLLLQGIATTSACSSPSSFVHKQQDSIQASTGKTSTEDM